MEFLVTYDISSKDVNGEKRLRKLAQLCVDHGQRVQKSVFECTLNAAQKEQFVYALSAIIDEEEDSLRIYRLREPREKYVEVIGKILAFDLHDPLII